MLFNQFLWTALLYTGDRDTIFEQESHDPLCTLFTSLLHRKRPSRPTTYRMVGLEGHYQHLYHLVFRHCRIIPFVSLTHIDNKLTFSCKILSMRVLYIHRIYIFYGHWPEIALRGHIMTNETNIPIEKHKDPTQSESCACDLVDNRITDPPWVEGKPLASYDKALPCTDNSITDPPFIKSRGIPPWWIATSLWFWSMTGSTIHNSFV